MSAFASTQRGRALEVVDFERLLCGGGAMASILSTAKRSHAKISSIEITLQKLSFRKTTRCLRNICAAELKPFVGARQGVATGQAEDLEKNIGACGESKYVLQVGACEPRVHVRHGRRRQYASALRSR